MRSLDLRWALAGACGLLLGATRLEAALLPSPVTPAPLAAARFASVVPACANPALFALPVVETGAPGARLRLAVAGDEPTRELGLMCVTRLRPHSGMIFVFARDESVEFWMKNTLIPLDMIWVRADGRVDTVAARVPASTRETPDDRVARRHGRGLYVIELAAGEAARDGIVPGARLSVPGGLVAR